MLDGIAGTSIGVARHRMHESARPDRLFNDPFAARLVNAAGNVKTTLYPKFHPTRECEFFQGYFALRTRFFDASLLDCGHRQVVLLASGLDARAFRLPWLPRTTLFEVDLPELMAFKERTLAGDVPRCTWVPVGADLLQGWTEPFVAAGFNPEVPTIWLIEGLLMYLSVAERGQLLTEVRALCAPGSVIAMDDKYSPPVRFIDNGDLLLPDAVDDWPAWIEADTWDVERHSVAKIGEEYGRPLPDTYCRPGIEAGGILVASARPVPAVAESADRNKVD